VFHDRKQRSSGQVQVASFQRVARAIESLDSSSTSWYNNTLESIEDRVSKIKSVSVAAKGLLHAPIHDEDMTLERRAMMQEFVRQSDELVDTLQTIAGEWIDPETQEALQRLPQYRIAVAGVDRVGEDNRLQRRTAAYKEPLKVKRGSGLHEFLEVEPRAFVRENERLPKQQLRVAAINFVEDRTKDFRSQVLRSQVVDEFVRRVELASRGR
jgi:hypothetical protein